MTRFRESDYRAVRRLCDEYLPRPQRAEAVMPGDFPGSTFEPERVVPVDVAPRRQHVVSCAVLIHDPGTGGRQAARRDEEKLPCLLVSLSPS